MSKKMKLLIVSAVLVGLLLIAASTQVDLTFQVKNILPAANGGTGFNGGSAANGSLPIGNGSGFSNATLTQGTGMTITNGVGTITLASNGAAANLTALTWAGSATTICNDSTHWFKSNQTFTGPAEGHLAHVAAIIFRNNTANNIRVGASPDGSNMYETTMQSDGNLVTHWCSGASVAVRANTINALTQDLVGTHRVELWISLSSTASQEMTWGRGDERSSADQLTADTHITGTGGTWSAYCWADTSASCGPAYVENF